MKAFIFPGQGSQTKGMGRENFSRFRDLTKNANEILGYSIEEVCLDDPRQELNRTEFTQTAIYVTSCMAFEVLRGSSKAPDILAGHSVGEYAALYAAGAFDFDTGLKIVKSRAESMAAITGGLAAVVGQSIDAVASLIDLFDFGDLEIANINSPSQTVVGGSIRSLKKFVALCSERKVRAVLLPVSGPFHTSHMRNASIAFANAISQFQINAPRVPVYSNTTARPHDHNSIHDTLARHIAEPVQWMECIKAMLAAGAEEFVEVGVRPILMPMIKEISLTARQSNHDQEGVVRSPSAIKKNPAARPLDFCATLGCRKPVIATSLGNGASGSKIVRALAAEGILAFLDVDGTDLERAERDIAELRRDPGFSERYGVALSAASFAYSRIEPLLNLLDQNKVRFIELSGFVDVPEPIQSYFASRGDAFLIARADSTRSIDNFFAYAASRPRGTCAICIDAIDGDALGGNALGIAFHALAVRERTTKTQPDSQVFLGIGGLSGNPWSIKSLISLGLDFVSAGSVLLLTQEANVDATVKTGLKNATFEHFQQIPNWYHPEFGKSAWTYVANDRACDALKQMHRTYMEESDPRKILQALQLIGGGTKYVLTSEQCGAATETKSADIPGMRRRLRIAMQEWAKPIAIPSDPSIAQWNAWKASSGADLPDFPTAIQALDLLYSTELHQ